MRRSLTLLGLLAALSGLNAPADAYPLGQRAPVLTPSACANVVVKLDFVAGVYCVRGQFRTAFKDLPGATFTRGSPKTALNSAGMVVAFASGVPAITDLGLLAEESRTNTLLRSQTLAGWQTPAGGAVADNVTAAPDLTLTGGSFTESSLNEVHQISQAATFVANSTNTFSVFVKAGSRNAAELGFSSTYVTGGSVADFSLAGSGSVTNASAGVTATIQALGNGWYRIAAALASNTGQAMTNFFMRPLSNGSSSYQGNGSLSLYLWGAQVEAGAFPTSYIPTTSSAATRAADVASIGGLNMSGPVGLLNVGQAVINSDTAYIHSRLSDGTLNNLLQIPQFSAAMSVFPQAVASGVVQFGSALAVAPGGTFRAAISYDGAGRYQGAANGTLGAATTGKSAPAKLTQLDIGNDLGANQPDTYFRQAVLTNSGLSDAQLQAQTR